MRHPERVARHTLFEDVQAIVIGTLFISLGVALFAQAKLLTGGTAGLAFLIHYATPFSFGQVFFVINLPFYYLAIKRMGWGFTIKTFCAVLLLSLFSELQSHFVHFDGLNPFYAGVVGGLLMGAGFLMLFRHRASLGGINIVTLYLQDKYGIRAGKLQMAIDVCIVTAALWVVHPLAVVVSVLGAVALNLILAVNHKPGRYLAM
ncbi:YitT family protein [Pseudogulbenkiania sp. MAI-1]|uniref:YitT family protein n=1 Tax=Pseudogulbenkiania sp. MAI-1 TaxID=990370 RepID=UPI00045EC563|nr:YitT family protein [Pseudogulbenkiania sp. MAI-1]